MLTQATRIFEDFNISSVTGGANILSSNFTIPDGGAAAIQIGIACTTSTVLDLVITDGTTTHDCSLNGGTALGAADLFVFTVPGPKKDQAGVSIEYNISPVTTTVVEVLTVDIIRGAPVGGANAQA